MRKSTNPDTVRNNLWRDANRLKYEAQRIRDAYKLLLRYGVIDGERVLYDPTKR